MFISSREFVRSAAVAVVAASSVCALAAGATTRWNCNLAIPVTSSGIFIDLDTRTSSTSSFTGWDMNLYSSDPSTGKLTAFGAVGTDFARAPGLGGLYFGNLNNGTVVSSSTQFTNGGYWDAFFPDSGLSASGLWQFSSINAFGFRWRGADGLTRYGFGCVTVGATSAIRRLDYLEWETTPNGAVTVTCPAPGAIAMALLGGLGSRRRVR